MIVAYLYLNFIIYLLFALWCIARPHKTAVFLGYSFLNNGGKTEYLAVYGGMEFGFAAFYLLCALSSSLYLAGMIFSVCFYSGLIIVRTLSTLRYRPVEKATYIVGALEYILGIAAAFLLYIHYIR